MVSRLARGRDDRLGRTRAERRSARRRPRGRRPGSVCQLLEAQADLGAAPAPSPPELEEQPSGPPPPPDGWVVERTGYDTVTEASSETLLALSNGFLGIRGYDGRGRPGLGARRLRRRPLRRDDGRAGGPRRDRRLGRDRHPVDGRALRPWEWKILEHTRRLDLRALRLERTLRCVDPDGRTLRLASERIVSLANRHVGAVRLELAVEDGPGARVHVVAASAPTRRTGRCRTSSWSPRAASARSPSSTAGRPATASPSTMPSP